MICVKHLQQQTFKEGPSQGQTQESQADNTHPRDPKGVLGGPASQFGFFLPLPYQMLFPNKQFETQTPFQ